MLTTGTLRYAIVAVNTPVRRPGPLGAGPDPAGAFHYAIPPELRAHVAPGQMVWAPFGRRRVAGIITGFSDTAPSAEIRSIEALAGGEPVVLPTQIALASWLANEYLASFGRALWLMLPPGVGQSSETYVEATAAELPTGLTLSPHQRAVWQALAGQGPVPLKKLPNLARIAGWRSALQGLQEKGVVRQWVGERPPAARPHHEAFVRLSPGQAVGPEALARAPKQRAAFEYLRAHGGEGDAAGWLPLAAVGAAAGVTHSSLMALVDRGWLELEEREVWRDPLAGKVLALQPAPELTPDQVRALAELAPGLEPGAAGAYLLHGVTGSGKTEIYLQAIARVLAQGRRALLLVPEIALTPQTIRRVAGRFPGRVAVWHSQLSAGERYDQWRRAMRDEVDVVIGPRSALLAPLRKLGLIVVDEEHEPSYKQESPAPRYHARDAAVAYGRITGAAVILGSATPDAVTAARAQAGEYTRIVLPQRVLAHRAQVEEQQARYQLPAGKLQPPASGRDALYAELPPVELVDLRRELREGNRGILSRSLLKEMERALGAHEQVILFLNRRGTATFVMCRDCGETLTCPRCEVALTYHGNEGDLVCHHCNYRRPLALSCPKCYSWRIKFFGLGTQRVVEAVHETFPEARVVRWDMDAARRRGSHEEFLRKFVEHEADVLVGTQMIAKGLDLPLVTVVGVISADTGLHLPDFRAAERTFQLLTQVAGRAGRSPLGGRVIIQTYTPEHYAVQAAGRHDYDAFLRRELAFRRGHGYPPFGRLVRLVYADPDGDKARKAAADLAQALEQAARGLGLAGIDLLGPAPCPLQRVRGAYRWQIVLRGPDPRQLLVQVPPPRGWRVDVDPVSFM